MITYIVSAYDRPLHLKCCLASISLQHGQRQIIVSCNARDQESENACARVTHDFNGMFLPTAKMGAKDCCYRASEIVIENGFVEGDWLCFPSDDSYYVPAFSQVMTEAATLGGLDLVYCDLLYDPHLRGRYAVLETSPMIGQIDKTCFLLKRDKFPSTGFPGKTPGKPCPSDGLLIQELVRNGIRHGKAPGCLVVHN